MRRPLLLACVWLCGAHGGTARADVIRPFEGACPPGLVRGIGDHREICVPRPCRANATCGRGAACRPLAQCMATRNFEGRAGPYTREVRVALCGRGGSCPDGARCRTSRQCEPVGASAGWDRRERRWTGESHGGRGGARKPGLALGGLAGASGLALAVLALRRRRARAAPPP